MHATLFHSSWLLQFVLPAILAPLLATLAADTRPRKKRVRIAIAGLVHGHVDGVMLSPVKDRKDVEVVGIFERNAELAHQVGTRYGYAEPLFFTNLDKMLDTVRPDAVVTFTNTYDHPMVVEACAARHLPVMMEKPLAVSTEHAQRIQAAATRDGIPVVVNYETTWYPSHAAIWELVKQQNALGDLRKMVVMDGHQGPKEIGVGPEFLSFLTDPKLNGAGALFDFGCYGANLMTWLMDNQRPLSVTALTQQIKPQIYARVDDEATALVEYPRAQGIIQASWNWPAGRKDFEVYGEHGYAIATGGNSLRVRLPRAKEETRTLRAMPPESKDALSYFVAVVRGAIKPSGLSSLENNMIATEILDAARKSARTGKKVVLPRYNWVRN